MGREGEALQEVVDLVARLRGSNGCPWDREQTHESLVPYLLEEAYELVEALQAADSGKVREELGDLLLQVVLHACIEAEQGTFTLADVAQELKDKLVRRHPHVFGSAVAEDAGEVRRRWEDVKRQEGALPDLARPALVAARKHVEAGGAAPSIPEDGCLRFDATPDDSQATIGQLLLQVVALARKWQVEPELALRRWLEMHCGTR